MDEQNDNSWKFLILLIAIIAAAISIIYVVTVGAVLIVTGLIAGSVYFGFKCAYQVAMDKDIWEARRISKHQRLETQLQQEAEYFRAKGYIDVAEFVEGQHGDRTRELYKERHVFDDTLNAVRKVREVFRK